MTRESDNRRKLHRAPERATPEPQRGALRAPRRAEDDSSAKGAEPRETSPSTTAAILAGIFAIARRTATIAGQVEARLKIRGARTREDGRGDLWGLRRERRADPSRSARGRARGARTVDEQQEFEPGAPTPNLSAVASLQPLDRVKGIAGTSAGGFLAALNSVSCGI